MAGRDQKWFLDQVADGKAGLDMPCIILATALGVNFANELLFRNTCGTVKSVVIDDKKNHDGKCSDCPYLYVSLQEWAAGSKMKCRVK